MSHPSFSTIKQRKARQHSQCCGDVGTPCLCRGQQQERRPPRASIGKSGGGPVPNKTTARPPCCPAMLTRRILCQLRESVKKNAIAASGVLCGGRPAHSACSHSTGVKTRGAIRAAQMAPPLLVGVAGIIAKTVQDGAKVFTPRNFCFRPQIARGVVLRRNTGVTFASRWHAHRQRCDSDGPAIATPRRRKAARYPELLHGGPQCPCILAADVRGRRCSES